MAVHVEHDASHLQGAIRLISKEMSKMGKCVPSVSHGNAQVAKYVIKSEALC